MYICENCGAIFDEPMVKRWMENHGAGIVEPWAEEVCPECGSEEYEEIEDGPEENPL